MSSSIGVTLRYPLAEYVGSTDDYKNCLSLFLHPTLPRTISTWCGYAGFVSSKKRRRIASSVRVVLVPTALSGWNIQSNIRWISGRISGQISGWISGRRSGWIFSGIFGQIPDWISGCISGLISSWISGWIIGWLSSWLSSSYLAGYPARYPVGYPAGYLARYI